MQPNITPSIRPTIFYPFDLRVYGWDLSREHCKPPRLALTLTLSFPSLASHAQPHRADTAASSAPPRSHAARRRLFFLFPVCDLHAATWQPPPALRLPRLRALPDHGPSCTIHRQTAPAAAQSAAPAPRWFHAPGPARSEAPPVQLLTAPTGTQPWLLVASFNSRRCVCAGCHATAHERLPTSLNCCRLLFSLLQFTANPDLICLFAHDFSTNPLSRSAQATIFNNGANMKV